MTGAENERLAVMERRMDDLCDRFGRVEEKLDAVLETKADKAAVERDIQVIRDRMWNLAIGVAGTAIVTLLGLGVYLLQGHITP